MFLNGKPFPNLFLEIPFNPPPAHRIASYIEWDRY